MSNEQYVYLGNITPEVSRKSSLVREDKRTVTIRQAGLTLTSKGDGSTLRLVDQRGKGKLLSIKIVTDNPYAQLLLELDDWRNDGETAAELLYGGTGKQDYGLYAMGGGNPATGYTLMYTPMGGESFDGRLRIALRNRLPTTNKVYGNANRTTFGGNLPIPVINGHSAGDSFSAPAFANESLEDIASAMATPHFGKPYMASRINSAALGASAKVGIDHPYVGLAGKPTFTKATLNFGVTSGSLDTVHTTFFASRTSSGDNTFSQNIFLTNIAGDALTTVTHNFAVGQKLFFRDGGTIFFAGEITAVDKASGATLTTSLPTSEFGSVLTGASQALALQLTVSPGLENPPGPVTTSYTSSTPDGIGTIVSQAETDPIIAIKSIEIKYQLEVSYDG